MTWYTDDGEPEADPRVNSDDDDREEEGGRGITIDSDADETVGQYSRDEPISFAESRRQARVSKEAAESRGETLEDPPLPDIPDDEETVEDGSGDADGQASTDTDVEDEEVFGELLQERLENGLNSTHVTVLATGDTASTSYSLIETQVEGETTYAMVESSSSGVVYRERLGNYGTEISTPVVSLDTETFVDAIEAERKHMERAYRYRDASDVVAELSHEQLSTIQTYYREVGTELIRDVLTMTEQERQDVDVSVSVVDNCAIVAGAGVTEALEEELEMWLSEKQLDVVLDALPGAVESTAEQISRSVRTEIGRQEILSGEECVIAGWVFLE